MNGPVRFLLPEGGVSMLDAPGQPFHDPEADNALFEAIEKTVRQTPQRRVERVRANINDDAFRRRGGRRVPRDRAKAAAEGVMSDRRLTSPPPSACRTLPQDGEVRHGRHARCEASSECFARSRRDRVELAGRHRLTA